DTLFFESETCTGALISVLNRRPQMLLGPLVARFKKINDLATFNWDWWTEVLAAPGPFLAPQAPSLTNHLIKMLVTIDTKISTPQWALFDVLLASMAAYDPDMSYGDFGDQDVEGDAASEIDAELEDSVDSGLFSFAQLLETLWSAKNMTLLTTQIIDHFASQGPFGIDRFYNIWLDRLLQAVCSNDDTSSSSASSSALVSIIERAVERDEALNVLEALNQCIQVRSQVSRNVASCIPDALLTCLIKTLRLPTLTDSALPSSDRLEACKLLQSILIASEDTLPSKPENIMRLSGQACTALLGALIRCLSDRSDTAKTERLKATLLPILLFVLRRVPLAVGKPFHPQLARLAVNVLKDLVAAVSIAGNPIDTDESHSRGQIA
ncbi:hypothetical protein EBZ37_14270, partial [bacterium]|nr:hypothetical protein [bacterium]